MKNYKYIFTIAVLILTSALLYLLWSWKLEGFGFPLDDAWIHQTYAKNLGTEYLWRYSDDASSGGSTGPAWGFLISMLYFLRLPPIFGTYLVGVLLMFGNSIISLHILEKLKVPVEQNLLSASVLLALEWHLVWSALSGMET